MNFQKNIIFVIVVALAIFQQQNCKNILQSKDDGSFINCDGYENESKLIDSEPVYIKSVANGQKYQIGEGDNFVKLVNVTGTPYEMGYAYGQLMSEEIQDNIEGLLQYAKEGVEESIETSKLPKFMQKYIINNFDNVASYLLELNWKIAEPYTPKRFPEEMQGMADGSGISYDQIRNINMVPELIKAACTIVGAWNESTKDQKLLTLRALDWEQNAPVNKNPSITVYHSNNIQSHPFANIGFAGLIGALTAVGSQGVSIQEKVWIPHGDLKKEIPDTYQGKPWAFVLRDLAEFGTTITNMADTLQNTPRTCKIHVGFASQESNSFEVANYSWKVIEFFNDKNYTSYNEFHPQLNGIVYLDKHTQPSNNYCVGDILKKNYGEITWQTLIRQLGGYHKTGDSQICVADVQENTIYLAYSSSSHSEPAYERSPIFIDLKPFYNLN